MSTAPIYCASWLSADISHCSVPKVQRGKEDFNSTNSQDQLALFSAAVFQISREEGWVQCNAVLFAGMGTAPMHNAAPLPAGLWHLLEGVDGSIIPMHFISHNISSSNRQRNGGACFPHLLFALYFYEFEHSCQNNRLSDLCVCWHQGRHLLLTDAKVGKPILADTLSQHQ